MNTPRNPEPRRPLRTSDLAAAGTPRAARRDEAPAETEGQNESQVAGQSQLPAGGQSPAPLAGQSQSPAASQSQARPGGQSQSPAASQSQARPAGQSQAPAATPTASESERLEPLFPHDAADRYRTRWAEVQSGFVDDPRQAVARGDELVAEVMKSLAESFAHERGKLEEELTRTGEASTETLRVGLRRYRSFFERLLSL